MSSVLLALIMIGGFVIAYHSYGKFLGRKVFMLVAERMCPSVEFRDDMDFVPTDKHILFGHHYTSIAGLGPIVGPAVALIWGWLPAVIWVFFGSIFIGAVHDFGALVVSLRHQGRTIGDLSGDLIGPRVRILFLLIIFFLLLIVIAIFALIIAILFTMYPEAVIPVWVEVPIALWFGRQIYKKQGNHRILGLVAVILLYLTVIIGAYYPIDLKSLGLSHEGTLITWMCILFIYAYIASVLPVQTLLQPRDYINAHQLFVAMGLLVAGLAVSRPVIVAPAYNSSPPGAPPLWPFLFVVIACGAVSGFHCLVSSGTSSKQSSSEKDASFIGYGAMMLEGALSTLVIISCSAGLGLGLTRNGEVFTGKAAFSQHYASWAAANGLGAKIDAFVQGAANMITSYGLPMNITITIMGVFLVSFAATSLDTATRLQRYIVGELAESCHVPQVAGRWPATFIAVITAFFLAFYNGSGKGALVLWPLFGTANQLLAGLALLVITIYLIRQKRPLIYTLVPMLFMVIMTGWAMLYNLHQFYIAGKPLLFVISLCILILELWMLGEAYIFFKAFSKRSAGRD